MVNQPFECDKEYQNVNQNKSSIRIDASKETLNTYLGQMQPQKRVIPLTELSMAAAGHRIMAIVSMPNC